MTQHEITKYANEYSQIPAALAENEPLRRRMIALIDAQPMPAKALEGEGRTDVLRDILRELTLGRLDQAGAIERVRTGLPPAKSPHANSTSVFPEDWDERLIRTNFSRFYNQAVLEELLERKETRCSVPHSSAEDPSNPCSRELAGRTHEVERLHSLLVQAHALGDWSNRDPKIPNHPHCTHVVKPI